MVPPEDPVYILPPGGAGGSLMLLLLLLVVPLKQLLLVPSAKVEGRLLQRLQGLQYPCPLPSPSSSCIESSIDQPSSSNNVLVLPSSLIASEAVVRDLVGVPLLFLLLLVVVLILGLLVLFGLVPQRIELIGKTNCRKLGRYILCHISSP